VSRDSSGARSRAASTGQSDDVSAAASQAPARDAAIPAPGRSHSAPLQGAAVPAADYGGRYARRFLAGWGTMDFNGHMANTAYLDLAADVRMAFFAEHGFPPGEFRRRALGPVVRKDEIEYFREVGLHDAIVVTYALLAMSPDGARFVIENEIWNAAGERAAVVRSTGGWLDLRARKLVSPPDDLRDVFALVPRAPGFTELASRNERARG
jgi:acyl-CoA thioester hydrolase